MAPRVEYFIPPLLKHRWLSQLMAIEENLDDLAELHGAGNDDTTVASRTSDMDITGKII